MRVLLAEDDDILRDALKKQLERERYAVDAVDNGLDALAYLKSDAEYAVAVMDIMMPGLDGMQALAQARDAGCKAPVLLLTARGAVGDKVAGLNAGADDYLVKPFEFEELLARMRALTRRDMRHPGNIFTLGDLRLDADRGEVTRSGATLRLTSREFALLEFLLRNKGVVLSRDRIERQICSYDYEGSSNLVDVYIRCLRKKVDEPFARKLIHTVRGLGYVLREE